MDIAYLMLPLQLRLIRLPIRDIPASIQVIPQQVLKDQQIRQVREAVSNVSGITAEPGWYLTRSTRYCLQFSYWHCLPTHSTSLFIRQL
ncbi:Plug domain-containing protein [Nostoc sp.]|uniref:Plug domain-containing protein n=1 Tax=Nostoc sp. TaxID=1180 RepID=UPI002FFBD96A